MTLSFLEPADRLTQALVEPDNANDPSSEVRGLLSGMLRDLDARGYRFVTTTPASHARVLARPDRQEAGSLRDVFGWSLPFARDVVPPALFDPLFDSDIIVRREDGRYWSQVRVSSVHDTLFLHSAFPTTAFDSVFLGPDSYRFADLIVGDMAPLPPGGRIMDYGAGAGVGGICAARRQPGSRLTIADINPKALFLASINAAHAGIDAETVLATTPADAPGEYDLVVTHPPFMIDPDRRAYRDGGDLYGARLSLDWVLAGARKLRPGGRLVLHTGVSIVDGEDVLQRELERQLPELGCDLHYRELDPDIFSEELGTPAYAEVERIAAVGACVIRAR